MIIVLEYVGGEIHQGPTGVEYSINPRIILSATETTLFADVKREIYRFLEYTEEQYSMDI
jgi:hypothetical protein